MTHPVLVEVERADFVESQHRGSLVVLDAAGNITVSLGEPLEVMLPRSAVKPAQAVASVECGAPVRGHELALAAASHSGEPMHIEAVGEVLARAGLSAADLGCPPDLPLDETALIDWVRAGHGRERIAMNCSGKHAAMLAACVAQGWPTESYLNPDHPLQVHARAVMERLAGEPLRDPEIDGCGAPLFGMSLVGLARLAAAVASAPAGSVERDVADAMREFPEYASGSRSDVARLMRSVPGLVCKNGAEGVHMGALPDGRAYALKVDDGSSRATGPIVVAALRSMGVAETELASLAAIGRPAILGRGKPVGTLHASEQLLAATHR